MSPRTYRGLVHDTKERLDDERPTTIVSADVSRLDFDLVVARCGEVTAMIGRPRLLSGCLYFATCTSLVETL